MLSLVREVVDFPGQFMFYGLLILADLGFAFLGERPSMPMVSLVYPVVTLVMLARVPFRIAREFRTLQRYDRLAAGWAESRPD
jgi:hypothetical protein